MTRPLFPTNGVLLDRTEVRVAAVRAGSSIRALGVALGVSDSALAERIAKGRPFALNEAEAIARVLGVNLNVITRGDYHAGGGR